MCIHTPIFSVICNNGNCEHIFNKHDNNKKYVTLFSICCISVLYKKQLSILYFSPQMCYQAQGSIVITLSIVKAEICPIHKGHLVHI